VLSAAVEGRRWRHFVVLVIVVGSLWAGATAPAAYAGQWMQVSCMNPDYSVAPSQGWSLTTFGDPDASDSLTCGPDTGPLNVAITAPLISTPLGSAAALQYTPPPGSTLAGGYVSGGLIADNLNDTGASGAATLSAPTFSDNAASALGFPCSTGVPTGEDVQTLSPVAVSYTDPPHVRGTSGYSGGALAVEGLVIYVPSSRTVFGVATDEDCAVPSALSAVCPVVAASFLSEETHS
jgi:hypothetical protein